MHTPWHVITVGPAGRLFIKFSSCARSLDNFEYDVHRLSGCSALREWRRQKVWGVGMFRNFASVSCDAASIGKLSPDDLSTYTASHARNIEFSSNPLWEPQITSLETCSSSHCLLHVWNYRHRILDQKLSTGKSDTWTLNFASNKFIYIDDTLSVVVASTLLCSGPCELLGLSRIHFTCVFSSAVHDNCWHWRHMTIIN